MSVFIGFSCQDLEDSFAQGYPQLYDDLKGGVGTQDIAQMTDPWSIFSSIVLKPCSAILGVLYRLYGILSRPGLLSCLYQTLTHGAKPP